MSSWADVEAALVTGVGTFIVDRPSAGCNDANVWWTRESIEARALSEGILLPQSVSGDSVPLEFDTRLRNPVFDRWCHGRYLDATRGHAVLVQTTHSRRALDQALKRVEHLRSTFPGLQTITTRTWMIEWAAQANHT